MRYRAKPVEIEALQFIADDNEQVQKILEWAGQPPIKPADYNPDTNHFEHLEVHTLEGVMRADSGDYIIQGTAGEFYPCKPDIFEAKYEQAGGDDDCRPNPPGARSASQFTTPERAAELGRGARRVIDQFRNLARGDDRG